MKQKTATKIAMIFTAKFLETIAVVMVNPLKRCSIAFETMGKFSPRSERV